MSAYEMRSPFDYQNTIDNDAAFSDVVYDLEHVTDSTEYNWNRVREMCCKTADLLKFMRQRIIDLEAELRSKNH